MTVAKQSLLILAPLMISTVHVTAQEERWRRLAVSVTLSVVDPNTRRDLPGQTTIWLKGWRHLRWRLTNETSCR
ncbi:hypothetical protein EB231_30435 [Mesorhizobium sp. NZP2298]|nr:hypothetical protein EB231_30435 [Mesorhizobium sp. NZP2298]